jgi:hypothetical protein
MCVYLDSLPVVPWVLFAQMSPDMSAVPVIAAHSPRLGWSSRFATGQG